MSNKTFEVPTDDFEKAEAFIKNWGSGQSSDIEMLEGLLVLMGYKEQKT